MLRQELMSILAVETREELLREVLRFTRMLGFDTVAAVAVVDQPDGRTRFIAVHNTPAEFTETFLNTDIGRRDPVMQHCRRSSVPIAWGQQTYVAAGQGPLWEHQAGFGYGAGIIAAMHMPRGRHFVLGVDRDKALPRDCSELTRMVGDLQLFLVHAQEAAMRILLPAPSADIPPLTARELESLRWTMEGKTAWELGHILGISEQTAARHINNSMQKLGCVNKLQAVLKALRLGLIQ
jgi:DNA-binding CsgD family transcriptional regulator